MNNMEQVFKLRELTKIILLVMLMIIIVMIVIIINDKEKSDKIKECHSKGLEFKEIHHRDDVFYYCEGE